MQLGTHNGLLSLAISVGITLAGPWSAAAGADYLRDIKPVLQARCYACHGALKQKAGLRVDTAERLREAGEKGSVIIPGKPEESRFMTRLTTTDVHDRMPLEAAPLKTEQIEAIRSWILAGAPIPAGETGEEDPRDHWSFRRIERPATPSTSIAGNPIDTFLAAKQGQHALKVQPEAERSLLLRRLYLDLVGLPPTPEQLNDTRPYEAVVDELLQSPQHGERWARHWMDVWRYTDWYGLGDQLRNSQKHLWHWRDWIVESLNADKGYDRMIQEMLAGDELAPNDTDALRATGFLARNYYLFNRTTWLDDTIEHTGKAFLGLTMNCAKCHDHKYDPIEQVDYYQFRALFEPHQVRLDPVPGIADFEKDGVPRVFDNHPDTPTLLHLRGDPSKPDDTIKIVPSVPAIFAGFASPIEAVNLPVEAWAPASRDYVKRDRLAVAREKIGTAKKELDAARQRLSVAPEKKSNPSPDGTWLSDSFDVENPGQWEIIGGGWKYADGKLVQSIASRDEAMVRSLEPHPRDFDLTCRYTTTGGTTYKSVTIRFDLTDDGKEGNFVYTSAYDAGPKVQVAYTAGGQSSYPADGAVALPIRVGEDYELRFAVRESLVNVWLNGAFVMAHRLPKRVPGGKIALSGFDATVAFDSIEVRPLAAAVELTEAKSGAKAVPVKAGNPVDAVRIAEAGLMVAETELAGLEAVIAADTAALVAKDEALAKVASQREGEAMKARAALDLITQEIAGDEAKTKAAKEAMAKAEKKIAAAETAYTPLYGAKKALETPAHNDATYPATYPATSTGRRLMLAKWMTSRENPLTARVAVNHVWMRHFGEPIVETVFDFGRQAKRPEQAVLLEWLAAEFMESGWSFRHLHRLIVTSAAYRRSSSNAGVDPATLAADPTNRFYWRANSRRMESQVLRDSLLQLAGTLDLKSGGPSVTPNGASMRRGLYYTQSPDIEDKFLSIFDNADILQCYRRAESIVPQQALALANSAISIEMAGKIADRLNLDHQGEGRDVFVNTAFKILLGRLPDGAELEACEAYGEEMGRLEGVKKAKDPEATIRKRMIHALLNHNDFIIIR